jgi:cytochrome c-type biogenesis protein CcmF
VPIGIALLFFMAVAPVLPWRAAAPGLLRERLAFPAWGAFCVLVGCLAGGIRGLLPLGALTLGAFAAFVALRQLALAAFAARRHGLGAWRGIVGRANGGMVTHIGIVVIAVGLTAASSFGQRGDVTLVPGRTVAFEGHRFELLGVAPFATPANRGDVARIRVDGGSVYRPAFSQFGDNPETVGTPAIDSSAVEDVYLSPVDLTIGSAPRRASAQIEVIVQPLIVWLWIGGGLAVLGAALAIVPGRRRRPTDPVSLLIPDLADEPVPAGATR